MSAQSWAETVLILREKMFFAAESAALPLRVETSIQEAIRVYLAEMGCSESRLKKIFIQLLKAGKVRVRFPKFEERLELLDYASRPELSWMDAQIEQCISTVRESVGHLDRAPEEVTRQIGSRKHNANADECLVDERTVFLRERKT